MLPYGSSRDDSTGLGIGGGGVAIGGGMDCIG